MLDKIFRTACSIMSQISNISAETVVFEQWSKEFKNKEIKYNFDSIRSDLSLNHDFWNNVFKLSEDEKLAIGFRKWEPNNNKMLIPLWIIESLPVDFHIEVECIDGTKKDIKDVDKDVRFGCVAYMI